MTKFESCRVALTESLADQPEALKGILARLEPVPDECSDEVYLQEMGAAVIAVFEDRLAASKATTKQLKRANAIAEQMKHLTTSATIH